MINRDTIDQITQQISRLFEQNPLPQDLQRNVRALLEAGLGRLDVVTRAEFDAQTAVLEHTRAKLDELETQLVDLAKQLGSGGELH